MDIDTEDYASVLLHFDGGQKGIFTVNQMACGHKNRVTFEINGDVYKRQHNNLTGCGLSSDWASHQLEHELSGMFDVAHGCLLYTSRYV